MERKKIFIIYHNEDLINEFKLFLYKKNNDINISKKFITDNQIKSDEYYYIDQKEVNIALKNNSLLYVITNDYVSTGITIDDLYNNDVFFLLYKEYNNIPDVIFNKYNIFTIWIDSTCNNTMDLNNELFCEISYIEQRLENVNYEYFMNDSFDDIYDCMNNFLKNSENSGENSENSSENI